MSIRDTVWELEEHTRAKHEILKGYLGAWFPILAQSRYRIVYIDGFAGPGVYAGGEEGSPVLALRTAREHPLRDRFNEIVFWFIEHNKKRYTRLGEVLQEKFPDMENKDSDRIRYYVVHGEFARSVEGTLDEIESEGQNLAPTFAFIDPFGFSNMPMRTVRRILGYLRCEVMVTFMDGYIRRFHDERRENALDEIYGTPDWRQIPKSDTDMTYVELYKQELKKAGAKYVMAFEIKDSQGKGIYNLVYATKNIKGMEVMKNAMLKASQAGEYMYSDRTDPQQQVLIDYRDESHWVPRAADSVFKKFSGKRNVPVEVISEHVVGHTIYPFRKSILKELESGETPRIVDVKRRKRKGTYPDGCRVSFSA